MGGHGQSLVNQETFGMGLEGDHVLAPQAEPFILQISSHMTQEGNINQETQQDQNPPPCAAYLFVNYQKRSWGIKRKLSGGSIKKHLDIRHGVMTMIDQICSFQPDIIPQVSGASNPCNVMVSHCIFGSIILVLILSSLMR